MKSVELCAWEQGTCSLPTDLLTHDVILPSRPDRCSLKFGSQGQHKWSADLMAW